MSQSEHIFSWGRIPAHPSISEKNAEQSKKDFLTAVSCIDKLAAKGIIHKNKAARHKARLNSKIKSL